MIYKDSHITRVETLYVGIIYNKIIEYVRRGYRFSINILDGFTEDERDQIKISPEYI